MAAKLILYTGLLPWQDALISVSFLTFLGFCLSAVPKEHEKECGYLDGMLHQTQPPLTHPTLRKRPHNAIDRVQSLGASSRTPNERMLGTRGS